jgi:hypothetical protein
MSETNQKIEQPFLPGLEYDQESKSFTDLYTDVRSELTNEEIDQLDVSAEIKDRLKRDAERNESGKIMTIMPVDGVIQLHGKEDVRRVIRALIAMSDDCFGGRDVMKECYNDLWEQVRQLVK